MIDSANPQENLALTLPITSNDRLIAEGFAAEQPTSVKRDQVRRNTLAVLLVNSYFNMLGIDTNLAASDSWNPAIRLCSNVADLEVTDVGKVECLAIRKGESSCEIPWEVRLRVGYIVVELDEDFRQGSILGFSPDVGTGILSVDCLHSLQELIDRLHDLKTSAFEENKSDTVNLSQWFNNIFAAGWETVDSLLNPHNFTPAFSFRSAEVIDNGDLDTETNTNTVSRATLINLGMQLEKIQLVLLIKLQNASTTNTAITLQLYPTSNNFYLAEGTQLIVFGDDGEEFMKAQARSNDNYIQLEFSGKLGERFTVAVSLNDTQIEQSFII